MLGFLVIYALFSIGLISNWLALLLCVVQILDILMNHSLRREYDVNSSNIIAGCVSAAIATILAWLVVVV